MGSGRGIGSRIFTSQNSDAFRQPVRLMDSSSLVKPLGAVTIDGITPLINDNRVLFTNLSGAQLADKNKVYRAVVVAGSVTSWNLDVDSRYPAGSARDGDIIYVQEGTSNGDKLYKFTGTAWSEVGGGAAAANQFLSNLLGPTSINQNLLPDAHNTRSIGTFSKSFFLYSELITITDGGVQSLAIFGTNNTPSGLTSRGAIEGKGSTTPLTIFTANLATTRPIRLETGNASAGASGDIIFQSGTATTTRGSIIIDTPTARTTGRLNVGGTTFDNAKFIVESQVDTGYASATNINDFGGTHVAIYNPASGTAGNKSGLFFTFAGANGIASGIAGIRTPGFVWETELAFYVNNITSGPNGVQAIQEQMRLNQNGFLGIGTIAPTHRLHVAGSIKIVDGTQAAGYLLTSDVNGVASWQPAAAGGANTALSNLTTTSINQDLIPSGSRSLGSFPVPWAQLRSQLIVLASVGDSLIAMQGNQPTPSGASAHSINGQGPTIGIGVWSVNNNQTGGVNSQPLYLETGNAPTSGSTGLLNIKTGNSTVASSGNINIQTGTASTTRGSIILNAPQTTIIGNLVPDSAGSRNLGIAGYEFYRIRGYIFHINNNAEIQVISNNIRVNPNVSGAHIIFDTQGAGNIGINTTTPGARVPFGNKVLEVSGTRGTININTTNANGLTTLAFTGPTAGDGMHINYEPLTKNLRFAPNEGVSATTFFDVGNGLTKVSMAFEVAGSFKLVNGTQAVGYVLTSDAAGVASWQAPAAGGANTSLSNLVTTNINQDLLPDSTANNRSVGLSNKLWDTVYTKTGYVVMAEGQGVFRHVDATFSKDSGFISNFAVSNNAPSGRPTHAYLFHHNPGVTQSLTVYTTNQASAESGAVNIETGNVLGGVGSSGNIHIQTGTSVGGSRGSIVLNTPILSVIGTTTNFGTISNRIGTFYAGTVRVTSSLNLTNSGDGNRAQLLADDTTPSAVAVAASFRGINASPIAVYTVDNTASGGLQFETGNASGGTSGNITLRTGTATGARGTINFREASLASASIGHVWSLTNLTTGAGNWTAAAAGGSPSLIVDANFPLSAGDIATAPSTFLSYTPSVGHVILGINNGALGGPYVYNGAGQAMTRHPDFNTAVKFKPGSTFVTRFDRTSPNQNFNSGRTFVLLDLVATLDVSTVNITTTAFSQSAVPTLTPGTNLDASLGSTSKNFNIAYVNEIVFGSNSGISKFAKNLSVFNINFADAANDVFAFYGVVPGLALAMTTINSSAANAIATDNIILTTGNKTAGTGNSGNINIATGTSIGGTRGTIRLLDASLATAVVGYVWTLTNITTGAGNWAAGGGGAGANTSLSNLTATSINQDLVPATVSRFLGSFALPWQLIYGEVLLGKTQVDSKSHVILNAGGSNLAKIQSFTSPSGRTGVALFGEFNGASGAHLGIASAELSSSTSGTSGDVYLESGNTTFTSTANSGLINLKTGNSILAASGNINLQTGTAATTRGTINFIDASLATAVVGHVWTLTNITTGAGNWAAGGGGGGALAYAESALSTNFGTTSTTLVDVTNLSVTFTTTGKRIEFGFTGGASSRIRIGPAGLGSTQVCWINVRLVNVTAGNTVATEFTTGTYFPTNSLTNELLLTPGMFRHITAVLAAGTYTFKIQVSVTTATTSVVFDQIRLFAKEL